MNERIPAILESSVLPEATKKKLSNKYDSLVEVSATELGEKMFSDGDSVVQTEKNLATANADQQIDLEGIFGWLFGSKKNAVDRLVEKVENLFDRTLADLEKMSMRENDRLIRSAGNPNTYMPLAGSVDMFPKLESLKRSVLSAIKGVARDYNKAMSYKEKAERTKNDYSNKLDSMRDQRDSYRDRYNDARRRNR